MTLHDPGLTLNGFNLDMHVESASLVKNPGQDVDDDWGDGRFHSLANAVVAQANVPDIVALQEIQDNDGAEMSMVVDASSTYQGLVKTIRELCGVDERLPVRIQQAKIIEEQLAVMRGQGLEYCVTGDFNDTEESETLAAIVGHESVNLVKLLAPGQRYDYNHRGKLQVLMHGIVPKKTGRKWCQVRDYSWQ